MSIDKKFLIIIVVLVIVLVGACDSDTPATRPVGRSSDNNSADADDFSDSAPTPEKSQQGSAQLSYLYKIEKPGVGVFVVQFDEQLTIEPGDEANKYSVSGSTYTKAYTQIRGGGGGTECFVQCDIPVTYMIDGKVIQIPLDQKGNCIITLNLVQKFEEIKAYGSCPEIIINPYNCAAHHGAYKDGRTYSFQPDDMVETPPDVDKGVTIKVELSDVVIPSAIKDTCRWEE